MSKTDLTLDSAILYAGEVAERCESDYPGSPEAQVFGQLAGWLKECRELKGLAWRVATVVLPYIDTDLLKHYIDDREKEDSFSWTRSDPPGDTVEDFFKSYSGCTACGSQRCAGGLEGALCCKGFLDAWNEHCRKR